MKQIVLKRCLSDQELENMIRRYHFNDTDFSLSKSIYQVVRPLSEVKVFYKITDDMKKNTQYDKNVICVMTLGNALDKLQDAYHASGKELEVYFIECLSMFILEQAYPDFEEVIRKETGFSLEQIRFPDAEERQQNSDKKPANTKTQEIGMIEIVDQLSREGMTDVIYNQAGMLVPKKSVVFYSALYKRQKDMKVDHSAKLCEQCPNKKCTNRVVDERSTLEGHTTSVPHHYGYQAIYGQAIYGQTNYDQTVHDQAIQDQTIYRKKRKN